MHPFADQCGFSKAGGGRDEGQLAPRKKPFIQSLDQARAEDKVRPGWGDIEFRRQNLHGHRAIIQRPPGFRKRPGQALSGLATVLYRNDDISPFVAFVHVPVGLGNLFQRIASIYDRV